MGGARDSEAPKEAKPKSEAEKAEETRRAEEAELWRKFSAQQWAKRRHKLKLGAPEYTPSGEPGKLDLSEDVTTPRVEGDGDNKLLEVGRIYRDGPFAARYEEGNKITPVTPIMLGNFDGAFGHILNMLQYNGSENVTPTFEKDKVSLHYLERSIKLARDRGLGIKLDGNALAFLEGKASGPDRKRVEESLREANTHARLFRQQDKEGPGGLFQHHTDELKKNVLAGADDTEKKDKYKEAIFKDDKGVVIADEKLKLAQVEKQFAVVNKRLHTLDLAQERMEKHLGEVQQVLQEKGTKQQELSQLDEHREHGKGTRDKFFAASDGERKDLQLMLGVLNTEVTRMKGVEGLKEKAQTLEANNQSLPGEFEKSKKKFDDLKGFDNNISHDAIESVKSRHDLETKKAKRPSP